MAGSVGHRKHMGPLIIIAAVALLVQFVYLAEACKDPTLAFPLADAGVYHEVAQRFAAGGPLTEGAFFQPPLFQLVLGLLYRVAGGNIFAARLVLILIATASCVLLGAVSRRAFGATVGLVAGIMLAFHGPFLFFSSQLLPTSLVILLSLAGLWLLLEARARQRWYWWLLSGLAVGLATITVPNALVLLLVGLGTLCLSRNVGSSRGFQPAWISNWARLAGAGALLLGTSLPIATVTLYNYRQSGEFVLIANNGGVNLYLGNNPDAEHTEAIRPGHEWYQFYRRSVAGGARTPAERNSYFFQQTWEYIRSEPLQFAEGLASKTRRIVTARELPRTFDLYVYRDFSILLRVLTWRIGSFAFPFGVLAPLAVLGVLVALGQRRFTVALAAQAEDCHKLDSGPRVWIVLLAFVLLYAASVVMFFVSARHRLPAVVLLIPFAAQGLVWLWGLHDGLSSSPTDSPPTTAESRRTRKSALGAAGAMLGVGLLVNLPLRAPTDGLNFRAELYQRLARAVADAGDLDTAVQLAQHALDGAPDYAAGCARLGLLRARQGALDAAEALFRRALTLDPKAAEVYWYLGNALHLQGRTKEALGALHESLALDPYAPEAHAVLADVLCAEGRTEEAIEHYRRALELPPRRPDLLFDLAHALALVQNYEESITYYYRGLAEAGPQPRAVRRLARLLLTCPQHELRAPNEAAMLAEHLVALTDQREPQALELLADAYVVLGRRADALHLLERAAEAARVSGDHPLAQSLGALLQRYQLTEP